MSYDLMVFEKSRAPKTKEEFMEWFEEQTHVQGNGKDGGSFVYMHRGRAGYFEAVCAVRIVPGSDNRVGEAEKKASVTEQ